MSSNVDEGATVTDTSADPQVEEVSKPADIPQESSSGQSKGKAPEANKKTLKPLGIQATDDDDKTFADGSTDEEIAFLNFLREVNGQDAYDNEAAALGKLRGDEYLALPIGANIPDVKAKDVGSKESQSEFTLNFLAQVYALNKARAPQNADAVKYGLARMEAVKMGWVEKQKEIVRLPPLTNAKQIMLADKAGIKEHAEVARKVAFLTPLIACHTFLTYGHHYLSGQSAAYLERYKKTFNSCLEGGLSTYLQADIQFHHLLHWVSPSRAREVWTAQLTTSRIPEALRLRHQAAPAGTAIIMTTMAAIEAMKASGHYEELMKESGLNLDTANKVSKKILADCTKYHKIPNAFARPPLSAEEQSELEEAKKEAAAFSPVAQGYIDALFKGAALGEAQALKKHANDNPMLRKRSEHFFRNLSKVKTESIKELYAKSTKGLARQDDSA